MIVILEIVVAVAVIVVVVVGSKTGKRRSWLKKMMMVPGEMGRSGWLR